MRDDIKITEKEIDEEYVRKEYLIVEIQQKRKLQRKLEIAIGALEILNRNKTNEPHVILLTGGVLKKIREVKK